MLSASFRAVIFIGRNYRLGRHAVVFACILTVANAPIAGDFNQRVLVAHNIVRERFGVSLLRWNSHLADLAEIRAKQLAASHIFEHATENSMSPQGENIWGGTKGYYSAEAMVNSWIEEQKYFKSGIFPDNSTTGNIDDVGHFTQLVWRNTKEVGCAAASDGEFDILVCRYSPPGNFLGEKPF